MYKHITLLATLLLTASAGAQTIMVSAEQARATSTLESACDGAWTAAMRASLSGHRLSIDETHAAQARCLLKTLSTMKFDSRDPVSDQSHVDLKVGLLLDAYAPSAYDYFANQLEVFPGRVQHGLVSALLNAGEPKATRLYFDARRAQAQPVSPDTPDYYRAMLDGHCWKLPCSPRLGESIAVVSANLDIAEAELRAVTTLTPRIGASADELRHIAAVQLRAAELLEKVQRIRSNARSR